MKVQSWPLLQTVWVMLLITGCIRTQSNPPIIETPGFTNTPAPPQTVYLTDIPESAESSTPVPDFNNTTTFQPRNSDEMQAFVMFHLNQGNEISEIDSFFDRLE